MRPETRRLIERVWTVRRERAAAETLAYLRHSEEAHLLEQLLELQHDAGLYHEAQVLLTTGSPEPYVGTPGEHPLCCPEVCSLVEWRTDHCEYGPDRSGWCMVVSSDNDGVLYYANVKRCPFCGQELQWIRGAP